MSKENLTIEYADTIIKSLQKSTESQRLTGEKLQDAEKFFIEFIELMFQNNISPSGCSFFTQILVKNLNQLVELPKIKELLKYANIYLELMKSEPSVYDSRGIITIP